MLETLFNKVAGLNACNFIKKRLQHRRFPVNIAKCLRTHILKKFATAAFVLNTPFTQLTGVNIEI